MEQQQTHTTNIIKRGHTKYKNTNQTENKTNTQDKQTR